MIKLGEGTFGMEGMDECKELCRQIQLDGLPADPGHIYHQFVDMVDNALALQLLFAGHEDQSAVNDCLELYRAIKMARMKEMGATHMGTQTRQ
jgi:hypothetical protein